MALAGDLQTMVLTDLLQWISTRRKTGSLHLQRRSTKKRVYFREGRICSSWSNDPRETLGQFLIQERLVTEEALFEALLRQEKEGRLLGTMLVEDGTLTAEQLRHILRTKAEEVVYDLFLWPEGKFDFQDGELPKDVLVDLDLDAPRVIEEGGRRLRAWARIRTRFRTSTVTFKVQRAAYGIDDPRERQILGLAGAGKSMREISLETRRSEFDTASCLFDLCERGALEVGAPRPGARIDTVGDIEHLLRLGAVRLKEKRFVAALEAYEEVLGVDRLNQDAKKGVQAVREGHERERTLQKISLDSVPVLRMGSVALTKEAFDAQEGFVLSRVNGQWSVQSILKVCPMSEDEALLIFIRLLDRKVIDLT